MTARGQQAATRASAAVHVGRGRAGSAVLVAENLLLTAQHVLFRLEPDGQVGIEFPGLRPGERLIAQVLPWAESAEGSVSVADVALLELCEPPSWLPEPVEVRAARRDPARVQVFGFPGEERDLVGVWRDFDVAGPAAGTPAVQLRWREDIGSFPGHSGGAVLDEDTGTLAGVLVEGSEKGRFDRYVPAYVAQRLWRQLPRPWLVVGPEGRDHFERRALGQRGSRSDEDLFRGRAAALEVARAWMLDDDPPGVPLVITGQPGAGKSAVLARTALHTLEAAGHGPGLAFHAREATHDDLLDALARLTGALQRSARREVYNALTTAPDTTSGRWLIAVDALDEAGPDLDELARTLREVAELDTVRMVVATRPRHAGTAPNHNARPSNLLASLAVEDDNLIALDGDRFFDRHGLVGYIESLLTQKGARDRAWSTYRSDRPLCRRLADTIADRAQRNYLVAVMAADPLHAQKNPVDPAAPEFDPTAIPSTVGDALKSYLNSLPDEQQQPRRGLLTALAYARGDGLDDSLWRRFAEALDYPARQSDLDALRSSAAADYLLQSTWQNAGGRRVWRLFHQALIDQLLTDLDHARDRVADEALLLTSLREFPDQGRGISADSYINAHLAEHAAAASLLDSVLVDIDFVLRADLKRLLPLLHSPHVQTHASAAVLRRSGARAIAEDHPARARLIALCAAHLGEQELCDQYGRQAGLVRPRWAHSIGNEHEELAGHKDVVNGVAFGQLPDGRTLLASASVDQSVRLWDPTTGTELATLLGHTSAVTDVAFGQLPDGRTLLASASLDHTVRLWNSDTGVELATLLGHSDKVHGVAFGMLVDGSTVLASASSDQTVRLWDPETGSELQTLTGHTNAVHDVAFAHPTEGRTLLASASHDRTVRLWNPNLSNDRATIIGHTGRVEEVAFGQLADGRTVVATASQGLSVRLWNPDSGAECASLTGHTGRVNCVAFGQLANSRTILATGGRDRSLRLWNPDTSTGHAIVPAHDSTVSSVAFGSTGDGHRMLASASHDQVVRLWNPSTGVENARLIGHTNAVNGVAFGQLIDGRAVLASASYDRTIRIWDVDIKAELATLVGHTNVVTDVAFGELAEGHVVLASASWDKSVRLWNAETGTELAVLTGHTDTVNGVAFGQLADGRHVLASASWDQTVRLWEPDTGVELAKLVGHTSAVTDVAFGELGDGRAVLASSSFDRSVRLWNPESGVNLATLTGHASAVNGVAFSQSADGGPVLVSVSRDQSLRLWDPDTGMVRGIVRLFGDGTALAVNDVNIVAAASNALCSLRLHPN